MGCERRGTTFRHSSFQIGKWRADRQKNVIETRGHRVHVEPMAMRVLACLAENAGEDVSRKSLIEAAWGAGRAVNESVVTNAVWELRKALGDDSAEPEFIQTVPGKGYRLIADVNAASVQGIGSRRYSRNVLYALGLVLAFLLGLGVARLMH